MPQSRIFERSRTLGYVCNEVPFEVRYIKRRRDNYITTCVGKSFHTYNASQLALLRISDLHPATINCMAINYTNTYTGCGDKIYVWRHGVELLKTFDSKSGSNVRFLLTIGVSLIAIDDNNVLRVWNVESSECSLEIPFESKQFQISALMHPATYINQILVGSCQGSMQLWNLKSSTVVFQYKGWQTPITCLEQAPALDVIGIGLSDGHIILHNLKCDKTIMDFYQDYGLVTNIAFRTDGIPMMATASPNGHLVFWDLEKKAVAHQLLSAHDQSVTGMKFLENEPLLITSSPDNTLKLWIFDMSDGGPRLLRIREGHSAPPSMVRFYDADNLLSSGTDSTIRMFNLRTERFNKSLGKALYISKSMKKKLKREEREEYKMPAIREFQIERTREKDWNNIVAVHSNVHAVTAWSSNKMCRGDINFVYDYFDELDHKYGIKSVATCIHLTHCGNFVLIGYSSGYCLKFNVQSGEFRGSYGDPKAHNHSVNGVVADIVNQYTITGSRKLVRFWSFKCHNKNEHIKNIKLESLISMFRLQKELSMLAVILEDFTIKIIDIDSKIVMRNLLGHSGKINDALFSPDCRWLITTAMDSIIKVWDLSTSQLIDHFRLEIPCVSLAMSPQGEYLATAHSNHLGIYLWSNKTLFSHVLLRAIAEDQPVPFVDMPDSVLVNSVAIEGGMGMDVDIDAEEDDDEYRSPEQLDGDLVTLSGMPLSHWTNILNIDTFKKRNRPKDPVKKPENAPFFLPTVSTLNDFQFDFNGKNDNLNSNTDSKIVNTIDFENLTDFAKFFRNQYSLGNFHKIIERIKGVEPIRMDCEISCLSPEQGGNLEIMIDFLTFLQSIFESKRNFDLAHAYLASFLQNHHSFIVSNNELCSILESISKSSSFTVEEDLSYCLSVLETLRHS